MKVIFIEFYPQGSNSVHNHLIDWKYIQLGIRTDNTLKEIRNQNRQILNWGSEQKDNELGK